MSGLVRMAIDRYVNLVDSISGKCDIILAHSDFHPDKRNIARCLPSGKPTPTGTRNFLTIKLKLRHKVRWRKNMLAEPSKTVRASQFECSTGSLHCDKT